LANPKGRKPEGRNLAQKVVRDLITEEEWRDAVESLWQIATSGTQPEWVFCPNCGRKTQMERVDLRARSDALSRLQEMGFGKPRVDVDDREPMVVHRSIVRPRGV
jgi:hypothetical protein